MIICTAGHVDHGKTTLVAALTGIDCDRTAEEKRRGITIELGFAPCKVSPDEVISIVDVPGHERLVSTMLSGAGGVEGVLLVVSAVSGPMPQTREHLAACAALGLSRGVVAMTFADRVESPELASLLLRESLLGTVLQDAEIVPVDARRGTGVESLRAALAALIEDRGALELSSRARSPFVLPIDRAFPVSGFGTVVTGSLIQGRLQVGDLVALSPGTGAVSRVRGLHVHGTSVDSVGPGTRVAVNLSDLAWQDVPRFALLSPPGALVCGKTFDAELKWLPHAAQVGRAFRTLSRSRGLTLHLHAGRAVAEVRADVEIQPGETATGRVRLDRPLPLVPGARFVLRGPPDAHFGGVLGGGRILDARPSSRRSAAAREALRYATPTQAIAQLILESDRRGIDDLELRLRLGQTPELQTEGKAPRRFAAGVVTAALRSLVEKVGAAHLAEPTEPGLLAASVEASPLMRLALELALSESALIRRGLHLARPTHIPAAEEALDELSKRVLRSVGKAGLSALSDSEVMDRYGGREVPLNAALRWLERQGRIVRTGGFVFPARELQALREAVVVAVAAGQALDVLWLKTKASVSRKHAIPLLEWLDATGVTIRRGDVRLAGPKAGVGAPGVSSLGTAGSGLIT